MYVKLCGYGSDSVEDERATESVRAMLQFRRLKTKIEDFA